MKTKFFAVSLGTPMDSAFSVNHCVTKWICGFLLLAMLVGCGGGGDESSGGGTYYGVTGVKNGSSTTVCLDNADYIDPNSDNGKNVTRQIASFYGLSGDITTLSGTGQSCADKFPLASQIITVDYYNKVVLMGGSSGGGAGGSPSNPTTTTPTPTPTLGGGSGGTGTSGYVSWTGSTNNELIRDRNNDAFSVRASDRAVVYFDAQSQPIELTGLTINTSAQIVSEGQVIGSVRLSTGESGSQIAGLFCADGGLMDIVVTDVWTTSCGGRGGGAGSTPGAGRGSQSRSFISWNNSINAEVVKDSTNEDFAFYSDTRCIYSYNRKVETANFCLNSSNSGSFDGQPVIVMLASATSGSGCIAVLADPSGYQIDIFTGSGGIQTVTRGSSKWETQGCTR